MTDNENGVSPKRAGMRLGEVKVVGELSEGRRLKLTIDVPLIDLKWVDLGNELIISGIPTVDGVPMRDVPCSP